MKYLVFIVLAMVLFSCKKEIDNPPVITIEKPLDNIHINAIDSFSVKGNVVDDELIKGISISIVNSDIIPVSVVYSFSPGSANANFDFVFELNNIELESGVYYMLVQANDKSQTVKSFVKIIVAEIETELTALWTVSCEAGASTITKYDRSSVTEFLNIDELCRDLVFNSYSGQVLILSETGHLMAYDAISKTLIWEKQRLDNYLFPYNGSLDVHSNLVYASSNNGDIYGYDEFGNLVKTMQTSDSTFKPAKFMFHENYVIDQGLKTGLAQTRLELLYTSTGLPMQYHATNMDVVDFSSFDSQRILVWGNSGSVMEVCTLNIDLQHLDNVNGFPSALLKSVAPVSYQKHFFLTNQGIYVYRPESFSVSLFKDNIYAQFIKYEFLENNLYVVGSDSITILDALTANIVDVIYLSKPIIDLEFSYNKQP